MARQDIAGLLTGMPQQQRPNPNMSSAEWRLAFGQQQSDNMARGLQGAVGGLMGTGMAGAASPQEQIQIADLKAQERIGTLASSQDPDELRQAAQLLQQRGKSADAARALGQAKAIETKKLSQAAVKQYAQENLTTDQYNKILPNISVLSISDIEKFIEPEQKLEPRNMTYTNTNGKIVDQLVFVDSAGKTYDQAGAPITLPDDAKLTITGRTAEDIIAAGVSKFTPKEEANLRTKLASTRKEAASLAEITDNDFKDFLSYKGRVKAKAGEVLSRLTGLGGEALNNQLESLGMDDLIQFSGEKSLMFATLENFFNVRRKEITGAAAAIAELATLREGILNGRVSPEEGRVKAQKYIDMANSYSKNLATKLEQGGIDITAGLSAEKLERANTITRLLENIPTTGVPK